MKLFRRIYLVLLIIAAGIITVNDTTYLIFTTIAISMVLTLFALLIVLFGRFWQALALTVNLVII